LVRVGIEVRHGADLCSTPCSAPSPPLHCVSAAGPTSAPPRKKRYRREGVVVAWSRESCRGDMQTYRAKRAAEGDEATAAATVSAFTRHTSRAKGMYDVEAVVRERHDGENWEYLVKWEGFPEGNTWEPPENFEAGALEAFIGKVTWTARHFTADASVEARVGTGTRVPAEEPETVKKGRKRIVRG
jgi:hypothetical protein